MYALGIETANDAPTPVASLAELYALADEIAETDGIDSESAFAVAVATLTVLGDIDPHAPVCEAP